LPDGLFEMHCDFTSADGGWTRVGTLDTSAGFCGNDALPDLRLDPDSPMAKVPDVDVHELMLATPGSPHEVMFFSPSDGRYLWHTLENVSDYDTSSKHVSSSYYCHDWNCDDGTTDSSACGTEGTGCPVTAHGIPEFFKKIFVDSAFARHIRGMHINGDMCDMPNYERSSLWIYVR
ncbi:MAG: hypothetical protein OXT09_03925, partial [Myxococcales bacterium]|nr:hypothetical protein [Myxococcales bacterium]